MEQLNLELSPELESSPLVKNNQGLLEISINCNKNGTSRILSAVPIVESLGSEGKDIDLKIIQGPLDLEVSDS